MRFKAYVLKFEDEKGEKRILKLDGEQIKETLAAVGKLTEDETSYSPMYVKKVDNLILGTLVQSYVADLKTFKNVDSNEEISIAEEYINDRVLFYIDLDEAIVYVQNKRYPAKELKHNITIERLQKIISKCIGVDELLFRPVEINYSLEEVSTMFKETNVREIHFKNLSGISVPDNAEIHNPMRTWDDTFAKSWNRYSKEDLNEVHLKAAKGKSLTKNPIARLCMILASIGKDTGEDVFSKMVVVSNDEVEEVKLRGNENKVINISKKRQEDAYEAYDCIVKKKYPEYKGRLDE